MLKVSNLLRELILEASDLPVEYALDGREARIMQLILDEIAVAVEHPVQALQVPMPQDERLLRACRLVMDAPGDEADLDHFADLSGMGRRTFTRAFRRETGISFSEWRQQVRLAHALSLLSLGGAVTTVAFDVGYNSPSAFDKMLHLTSSQWAISRMCSTITIMGCFVTRCRRIVALLVAVVVVLRVVEII